MIDWASPQQAKACYDYNVILMRPVIGDYGAALQTIGNFYSLLQVHRVFLADCG